MRSMVDTGISFRAGLRPSMRAHARLTTNAPHSWSWGAPPSLYRGFRDYSELPLCRFQVPTK
jgi:hypothetical protein